jgi:ABC-type phosphate/phosphonate transport system substrate-binding protein
MLITLTGWFFECQVKASDHLEFIGVAPDPSYRQADDALAAYLAKECSADFHLNRPSDYLAAINAVREHEKQAQPYVARLTPYALVAAKMLGAECEELGTYFSKATHAYTYSSYFAVNKETLAGNERLYDLLQSLQPHVPRPNAQSGEPPALRFVYHDEFSTSSFFLPSLYFREQRAFIPREGEALLIPTKISEQGRPAPASSLLQKVAAKEADLAAVWNKTKNEASPDISSKIEFIQLPTTIPNDILVCAGSLKKDLKERLRTAIRKMKGDPDLWINRGDFAYWVNVGDAPHVRESLAELFRKASAPPSSVTIEITGIDNLDERCVKAARESIRLSGTEFVEYDEDFYKHVDVKWTLKPIHDGALRLESNITNTDLKTQAFDITYVNPEEDLIRRFANLIHSRLNRIRYVWPYLDQNPVVIRDVDFAIPVGSLIRVQRINWIDPDRNDFSENPPFKVHVVGCGFHTIELNPADFRAVGEQPSFQPMSPIAYRVILERPLLEGPFFKALTIVLVSLFLIAFVAGILAVFLKRRPRPGSTLNGLLGRPDLVSDQITDFSLAAACQQLVEQQHNLWRDRQITRANVLYCARSEVEDFIEELNAAGLATELVRVRHRSWKHAIGAKLPFVKGLLNIEVGGNTSYDVVTDPKKVPDQVRLAALISSCLKERTFSRFVGKPVEWEALHRMINNIFGFNSQPPQKIVCDDSSAIAPLISKHFSDSVAESLSRQSLFMSSWLSTKDGEADRYVFETNYELPAKLTFSDQNGATSVQKVNIQYRLPADQVDRSVAKSGSPLKAWVLGRVIRKEYNIQETLQLQICPLAILLY